jgi:hypothetical protein
MSNAERIALKRSSAAVREHLTKNLLGVSPSELLGSLFALATLKLSSRRAFVKNLFCRARRLRNAVEREVTYALEERKTGIVDRLGTWNTVTLFIVHCWGLALDDLGGRKLKLKFLQVFGQNNRSASSRFRVNQAELAKERNWIYLICHSSAIMHAN